ncbi:MAG: SPOR domain-containing protein [Nitrosomonadales bacterium]|nr:SPOR domain-containing protein [Nitrosomonadales bacterium]
MRALFWILLLGNVILFAVMQRGGLGWGEQAYQPQPVLHEEKIRLLDANQSAPVKALPVPATTATPVAAPAQMTASAPVDNPAPGAKPATAVSPETAVIPPPVAVKPDSLICLEWGDFSGNDLKRATEILSAMQLGDKLSQRHVEYNKGYWVYIPPLKNKAAANRKVSQLKALGIREYFIVQDAGAMRYAISLGVFKSQEAAQKHLSELQVKGVRSAKVGERTSKLKTTMFMLNNVDALIEDKLAETGKDFSGSELKNVPCALTR